MTHSTQYFALIFLLLTSFTVNAETNDCTAITALPFNITKPGLYCLTGNLNTNRKGGSAIKIRSDDVTIDLNGWTLDGLAAGSATKAVGIYAFKRSNCTIRNGTVRGFYQGILLFDPHPYVVSRGHLVENVLVEKSTFTGIQVNGSDNVVRNNHVTGTGHSTFQPGLRAYGMQVYGFGVRVIGNDISNTVANSRADGYGLVLGSADSSIVQGNRINDVYTGNGKTYGIYISASDDLLLRDNNIINVMNGIFYTNSTGKNMGNLTTNVMTPFTGGVLTGIND